MGNIRKIHLGLQIIEGYSPNDNPQFDHDVIYAGLDTFDKMTDVDKANLEALGWRYDERQHCWRHF